MSYKFNRKNTSALQLTPSLADDNPSLQKTGADLSGSGMAFSVDFQKMFEVEMGVFLCRRQAFVTEELLDNP